MPHAIHPLCLFALLATGASVSCGPGAGGDGGSGGAGRVATWRVSAAPVVDIGVREGEAPYELDRVAGAVRLSDGGIAVLNGASDQIRFFTAGGRFRGTAGREGDGPGELRLPVGLKRLPADALRVWDAAQRRHSYFLPDGTFLRSEAVGPPPDPRDSQAGDPFSGDVWVYGWSWIDSPLPPEERGGVVQALAHLPPPDTAAGARYVRVTDDGLLWVTAPMPPAERPSHWTVYRPDGTPVAELDTPTHFLPFEVGRDWILGRATDSLDVQYVREYALDRGAGAPSSPGLDALWGQGGATWPPFPEDLFPDMMQAFRQVAGHQEMYYSRNRTYVPGLDALDLAPDAIPPRLLVQVVSADPRGWVGFFLDRATGASCVLAYGATIPEGWPSGGVVCPGREAAPGG